MVSTIERSRGKSRFIEDPRPACPDLSGTHRDPENRDKREMPLSQRIFMNTPQINVASRQVGIRVRGGTKDTLFAL